MSESYLNEKSKICLSVVLFKVKLDVIIIHAFLYENLVSMKQLEMNININSYG
jgi:hypothetical protein